MEKSGVWQIAHPDARFEFCGTFDNFPGLCLIVAASAPHPENPQTNSTNQLMTMEATAESPTAAPSSPPSSRHRQLATAVFVVFCLYVAAIYVLALDQSFHCGLFPSLAEREIAVKVQQLGDPSLTKDKREAVVQDIVNWNSFSVPVLLKAIEQGPSPVHDPALKCLQTLALKYYNEDLTKMGDDPVKLKQWWVDLQAGWAKAESEKK